MNRAARIVACAGLALICAMGGTAAHAEAVATEGAEVGKWTMDFDAAKKLAAEKKLPILINFTGSDWCGWCKLMDKQVFAQKAWKDYAAANMVLVTIDFPNDKSIVPAKYVERNEQLSKQFGIEGFPTYIVLDPDGKTALAQLGAGKEKTPESFIAEISEATMLMDAVVERKAAKLEPEKAKEYRTAVAAAKSVEKEFREWLETKPQRNAENDAKYQAFLKRMEEARAKVLAF